MSNGNTVMRVEHRELTIVERAIVEQIRQDGAELWDLFDALPSSREVSLAKTKLQEAVMWAEHAATK